MSKMRIGRHVYVYDGAHSTRSEAEREVRDLRKQGYVAKIVPYRWGGKIVEYHVWIRLGKGLYEKWGDWWAAQLAKEKKQSYSQYYASPGNLGRKTTKRKAKRKTTRKR